MGFADRLAAVKSGQKIKCLGCDSLALLNDEDRAAFDEAVASGESVRSLSRILTATLIEDYGRKSGIGDTALGRHLAGHTS